MTNRRDIPNSVGGEHEVYHATGGVIRYFPEDVALMGGMSEEDRAAVKLRLLETKRYLTDGALEELLHRMVAGLRRQVAEKVPEQGAFPVVYERYENPEKNLRLSHVILKVTAVREEEFDRYLELAAVNYPHPYGAETVLVLGTKQAVLDKLAEPGLVDELLGRLRRLEKDIEDEY